MDVSYQPNEVQMAIAARLRVLREWDIRPERIIIGHVEARALRHSFCPPLDDWPQSAYFQGIPLARIDHVSCLRVFGQRDGFAIEVDDAGQVVPWQGYCHREDGGESE